MIWLTVLSWTVSVAVWFVLIRQMVRRAPYYRLAKLWRAVEKHLNAQFDLLDDLPPELYRKTMDIRMDKLRHRITASQRSMKALSEAREVRLFDFAPEVAWVKSEGAELCGLLKRKK